MHGGASDPPTEPPITPELLADLQAGLLDDATAAQVRHRARTDPTVARHLAALERVRRDLADLGTDATSAPAVPAAVTAQVEGALRSAHQVIARPPGRATHAADGTRPRLRFVITAVGAAAALAAVGVGTATLLRPASPALDTAPTINSITVARPPSGFPLSEPRLVDLLSQPPDFGPLGDPQRRASCLAGLGYPASTVVLGATPATANGRPAVILLVPGGDAPNAVTALAVRPDCSSVDTGLLAEKTLTRP